MKKTICALLLLLLLAMSNIVLAEEGENSESNDNCRGGACTWHR